MGRGINLQIVRSDIAPVLAALAKAGWPLHLPLEETRYRVGAGGVTHGSSSCRIRTAT